MTGFVQYLLFLFFYKGDFVKLVQRSIQKWLDVALDKRLLIEEVHLPL